MSLQYSNTTSIPNSATVATTPPGTKSTSSKSYSSSLLTNINWIIIVTTTTLVFSVLSWYYLYSLISFLSSCFSSPDSCLNLQLLLDPLLTQMNTSVVLLESLPSTTGRLEAELVQIKLLLRFILCTGQQTQTQDEAVVLLCSTP